MCIYYYFSDLGTFVVILGDGPAVSVKLFTSSLQWGKGGELSMQLSTFAVGI